MGKKTITGDRPTSGKHFAREHKFAKRKGELEIPNHDPMQSNVAKNFETSKKVEGLLNRLAGYMAGEIPDNEDLDTMLGMGEKEKPLLDDGVTTENPTFDDATTNYTKLDNEPIKPPTEKRDPVLVVEADED